MKKDNHATSNQTILNLARRCGGYANCTFIGVFIVNKDRRARLESIWFKLEDIISEEQEAFDNLPEGLQYSEKGEAMEQNIEQMDEARDLIGDTAGI